jgi:chromate transport protein ChrA
MNERPLASSNWRRGRIALEIALALFAASLAVYAAVERNWLIVAIGVVFTIVALRDLRDLIVNRQREQS